MALQTILVIGAGQMGSGIAQVAATAGINVKLHDIKQELVEKGFSAIQKNLGRDVTKGRKTAEEEAAILDRITLSTNLQDGEHADFVIEAIVEKMSSKAN